jgi:hypothetical protein
MHRGDKSMCGKNAVKKELLLSLGMRVLMLLLVSTNTVASVCLSDLDGDGKVHYSDLKIMNSEAGRNDCSVTPCQADLNDDGKVTSQDREILYTEFGRGNCLSRRDNTFEENIEAVQLRQDERFEVGDEGHGEEGIPYDDSVKDDLQRESTQPTRFEENGDGTVTDTQTGLMWTKDANLRGDTVLFHQAISYINGMQEGKQPNFGYTDWRLPTLKELQSLIEYAEFTNQGHVLPTGHPFHNVQSLRFYDYTSPTYLSKPEHSWFIDAYCRIVGHNVGFCFGFVWPVRGGQ